MALRHDITVDQGATYLEHILITRGGEPLDLVGGGYAARMQVRKSYRKPDIIMTLSTENGLLPLHMDGVVGRVSIALLPANTINTNIRDEFADFIHDLEIYKTADPDTVYRVLQGTFTLNKNVTTLE